MLIADIAFFKSLTFICDLFDPNRQSKNAYKISRKLTLCYFSCIIAHPSELNIIYKDV